MTLSTNNINRGVVMCVIYCPPTDSNELLSGSVILTVPLSKEENKFMDDAVLEVQQYMKAKLKEPQPILI